MSSVTQLLKFHKTHGKLCLILEPYYEVMHEKDCNHDLPHQPVPRKNIMPEAPMEIYLVRSEAKGKRQRARDTVLIYLLSGSLIKMTCATNFWKTQSREAAHSSGLGTLMCPPLISIVMP